MRKAANIVDGVFVTIYERAIKDEDASKDSDTPVFRTAIYIKKKVPNSRDLYDQPVKSTDKEKYGELFEAFEKGEKIVIDGTPIEQWPQLDVTQVETLKAASIFTVQQLAGMSESGIKRLPTGYITLKTKAGKWINQGAELDRMKEENKSLEKRLAALEKKAKAA